MMAMAYIKPKNNTKRINALNSTSDVRLILIHKFAETSKAKFLIKEQIKNPYQKRHS